MACCGVRGCRNITVIISIILIIRAVIVLYHGRQRCLKVARSTMPPLNLRDRSNARMDSEQRAFGPSIIGLVRVFSATDSIIATCAPSICARDAGALNENKCLPTNVTGFRKNSFISNCARHSEPRPAYHCRVLPPG